jgi:hypothetical protein
MKVKVNEAEREVLDWMVVMAHGEQHNRDFRFVGKRIYATQWAQDEGVIYSPSATWANGGPIIERERLQVTTDRSGEWICSIPYAVEMGGYRKYIYTSGPTPLIAAMRCYVVSKLGEEVRVPEELK